MESLLCPSAPPPLCNMRHLLLNKNFVRLWLGQLISGVATILFDVGVMVTIFEETGSALQTAMVTVAATLPHFLLGPLAGAIVDRYPRRTVLMVMDMGRALLVASLLLILQTTAPNVWVLYFIVIGLAAAMALHEPARSAIIPELVTRQQIVTANSLILSTRPLYYAIGYLLGGALVLVISFRTFIMVSVGLFVAAAVLEMFISGERREEREIHFPLSPLLSTFPCANPSAKASLTYGGISWPERWYGWKGLSISDTGFGCRR